MKEIQVQTHLLGQDSGQGPEARLAGDAGREMRFPGGVSGRGGHRVGHASSLALQLRPQQSWQMGVSLGTDGVTPSETPHPAEEGGAGRADIGKVTSGCICSSSQDPDRGGPELLHAVAGEAWFWGDRDSIQKCLGTLP